ncbi:MAG: hypothetical protein A2Y10_14555 [Planctomycetes bacterium GWF2_41_51]|nr:MAG: hypothetical protein A2Y10_14555 [Planctomycetes bacterium GWF2_41_51]HBG25500.1 hypothetical protein [Phycisphaerales bacterium]
MMKQHINKNTEDFQQALSLEESILGPLGSEAAEHLRKSKAGLKPNVGNSVLLDVITDQAKAKFVWQCVTISFAILFAVSSVVCFNLYSSRQNLAVRVNILEPLEKELKESRAQTDNFRAEAIKASAELNHTQNDLNNSKSQIENLNNQLADLTDQLETLKARNAEAVKMLNGRLKKLSDSAETQIIR